MMRLLNPFFLLGWAVGFAFRSMDAGMDVGMYGLPRKGPKQ